MSGELLQSLKVRLMKLLNNWFIQTNLTKVVLLDHFFVLVIFIVKETMIFIANLGSGQVSEQLFIETASWSSCVSYCENTGKDIRSINMLPTSTTFVINVSGITNCFVVTEVLTGNVPIQYYVWDNDFESVANWIAGQGDVVVRNVTYQKISFVSV